MRQTHILRMLVGGDHRSIGKANKMVAEVLARPKLFGSLIAGLSADDPIVRARTADAVEKISAQRPNCLRPYKSRLLGDLAQCRQKEVRWHLAQMLPRIRWNGEEQRQVYRILVGYLRDSSSIVKTFAMQALADLAIRSPALRPAVLRTIRALTTRGTPAMRARGRRLLPLLTNASTRSSTVPGGTPQLSGARGRRNPYSAS